MSHLSRIQNPIGKLLTVDIFFRWKFVIARHTCHRCIYLLVTVIFAVVSCMITFFIKAYLLSPFLIIFWCLWKFYNHLIFISTSKAFPRRTFCLSIVQNINCASSFLFLSYPFEAVFCRVICTSKQCALCLKIMCSFTISTKTWAAIKI